MKYGVIYNVFINLMIFLVIVLNFYVMIRYTRKSVYGGFVQNAHIIHNIIMIHRLYVGLWTAFQISSFIFVFIDNHTIKVIHGIIMACSPLVISITFIFSISINVISSRSPKIKENMLLGEEINEDTSVYDSELSDSIHTKKSRHLVDSLLILNPVANNLRKSENTYVDPQESAFKQSPFNQFYWEISDNFKEVLRREVVEYIVKAFDVLFEQRKRENFDENIRKETLIKFNNKTELSETLNKPKPKGCLAKIFGDNLLRPDEEQEENFEFDLNKDKMIYGHPDIMKRIDLLSKEDIDDEARNETVFEILRNKSYIAEISKGKSRDFSDKYELIELAPLLFQNIRKISKITNGSIKRVFSQTNVQRLEISVSQGKGGSFFIRPADGKGKVLIKSITIPEYGIIKKFLPKYYGHLLMHPNSFLVPILGVYKLKLHKSDDVAPIAFILMRDALDIKRTDLGPKDRMFTFDLKGSLHDRQVLSNPKDIFSIDADYDEYKDIVFKDIDFLRSFNKLDITNIQSSHILSQFNNDFNLLKQNNFMDYSILVYIIIRPYASVKVPMPVSNLREKMLFSGTLDQIDDVIDEDDSEDEKALVPSRLQTAEFDLRNSDSKRLKSRSNLIDSKNNQNNNRVTSNSPSRENRTYFNRTTQKQETLTLIKSNSMDRYSNYNRKQEALQPPDLKQFGYFQNIKGSNASDNNDDNSRLNIPERGSVMYVSESNINANRNNKRKKLLHPELMSPVYDGSLLVLKEKCHEKLRIFHI